MARLPASVIESREHPRHSYRSASIGSIRAAFIAAGVVLPAVSETFAGKDPDLGAIKTGQPKPVADASV
jgi:hypothetical protein